MGGGGREVVCLAVMYSDAIKSRKCLWFQEAVVRFDLMRNGTISA
jgi:hypothetical protein